MLIEILLEMLNDQGSILYFIYCIIQDHNYLYNLNLKKVRHGTKSRAKNIS